MMQLKECRQAYYDSSGQLSDNCRKLAFAGIAVIWIFKQEDGGIYILSTKLLWALFLVVSCLSFDLLQYIYKTVAWGIYHRKRELKDSKSDREFLAPCWINWPAICFLGLKVISIIIAYIYIFMFILDKIKFN